MERNGLNWNSRRDRLKKMEGMKKEGVHIWENNSWITSHTLLGGVGGCTLGCPTKTLFSKKQNGATRFASIWGLV